MAKTDDTLQVPHAMTSPWIKRFLKRRLGITVRCQMSKHYVNVWVPCDHPAALRDKLVYNTPLFPPELGNRCMRLVYPNSENLREQKYGGNIQSHSISMSREQFRALFAGLLESPLELQPA